MVQLVAHHARLEADATSRRIHCENTGEMFGDIDDQTVADTLPGKRRSRRSRDQAEPVAHKIDDLFDFVMAVVRTYLDSQNSAHLHSDDWQRTVYIDTLGVGMTQFDVPKKKKEELLEAGRVGVQRYFDWYDAKDTIAANK